MASRPYLVLGAAVLAVVAGTTAAAGAPRGAESGAESVAAATTPAATQATASGSARSAAADADHSAAEHSAAEHSAAERRELSARVTAAQLRRVEAVQVDAESIRLTRADDRAVVVLPMRRGTPAVRTLTRLLGTPTKTQTVEGDGGRCLPASTTYTWGGALRVASLAQPSSLGNTLEVRVLRPDVTTRAGDAVELTGPDGVQVGDDIARVIHDSPADRRDALGTRSDPAWQVLLGEGWRSDARGAGTNGVSALTDGTRVTVIGTPMPVHADARC